MSLFRLFLVVIFVAFVGLFFLYSSAPSIIAYSLSDKTKVEVEIEDITLSPNSVVVEKFQMGNPISNNTKSAHLAKAFSADRITVAAPLTNYLHDAIVIDEIMVQDIYVGLEFGSVSNPTGNWGEILGNLKKNTSSKDSSKEMKSKKEKSSGSVLIKKLILTNINIDLLSPLTGGKVKKCAPIERLEFSDISSDGSGSIALVLELILSQALPVVLKNQGLGTLGVDAASSAEGVVDSLLSPIKGWFTS